MTVGVAVADRRAGPHPSYRDQRRGERQRRPERGGAAAGRCRPARRRPGSWCGGCAGRSASRRSPRGGARRGRSPQPRAVSSAQANRVRAAGVAGVGRVVGAAEVTHHARPPRPRRAARPAGRRGTAAATPRARAVARHARRRGAGAPGPGRGAGDDRGEVLEARDGEVDADGLRRSAKSASTGFSQLSIGASMPGVAQRPGLGEAGHAERRSRRAPARCGRRRRAPCPNPSALTTAISRPVVRAASSAGVRGDGAERSTSSAGRWRARFAGDGEPRSCRHRLADRPVDACGAPVRRAQ